MGASPGPVRRSLTVRNRDAVDWRQCRFGSTEVLLNGWRHEVDDISIGGSRSRCIRLTTLTELVESVTVCGNPSQEYMCLQVERVNISSRVLDLALAPFQSEREDDQPLPTFLSAHGSY